MLRKRLEIILIATIVCAAIVSIKANENDNTINTAVTPASGKVVILDAGHRTELMVEL